jgi:hypothetical protein
MPYLFGGATTDHITWPIGLSTGASATAVFVHGWWLPSVLTATRGLWSIGAITGAEVNSTTDELRLRTNNTTDGQWTTTGVDCVVDEWKFIAFFLSCLNTGSADAWRVWAGDVNTPPAAITLTEAVASSGNFTGDTNFTIGNKSTGSLAYDGRISHVGLVATNATAGVTTNPFGVAAYGAVTAAEEQLILERFVWPAWYSETPWFWSDSYPGMESTYRWFNVLNPLAEVYGIGGTTIMPNNRTLLGAAQTSLRAPRPLRRSPLLPPRRR